jgi:hypothetical protein
MLTIDMKQARELERFLGQLNARGIKFAQRDAINDMAFATQKTARDTIRSEFTNRNTWTVRTVMVDRARSTRDSAEVGSTEYYMAQQEFGATLTKHTQMATPAASGESNRSKIRRKPVRMANRMSSIRLAKRNRGIGSRAQQNIVALKEAKESGRKFVYLDRGRVKGIYKVMGTKRKPKSRMVQDMSRRVAVIPRNPWLAPSSEAVMARAPEIYHAQLVRQLGRLGTG